MTEQSQLSVVTSKKKVIWLSIFLFFFEVYLMAQFVIPFLVIVWQVFISLPMSFAKKYRPYIFLRIRNISIYLLACFLAIGANIANNKLAHHRAEILISSVKAFQVKNSRYPKSLDELVPEFINSVPPAKYTAMGNFRYLPDPEKPMLFYVEYPPFGRPTYIFGEDRWWYND